MIKNKKPAKDKELLKSPDEVMIDVHKYIKHNSLECILFLLGSMFSLVMMILLFSGILCPVLPFIIYAVLMVISVDAYHRWKNE